MSFIQPVQGRVSSAFGVDRGSHAHGGIDLAAPCGTPVVAAAAGRVSAANYSTSAGNLVHIEHGGGWQTRYFHLQRSIVGVGATVAQGQVIGYVGSTGNSTGCHLHWEARINGQAVNPLTAGGPQIAPVAGSELLPVEYESADSGGAGQIVIVVLFGALFLGLLLRR